MKKAPRFFLLTIVLCLSMVAKSAPFQDSDNRLANQTSHNLTSYSTSVTASYVSENKIKSVSDRDSSAYTIDDKYKNAVNRLKQQAASLKEYAKAGNFNTEYCFLVDMSVPSGKKRFFVYNMKKDVIEYSALVAHGAGSDIPGSDQLSFSNIPNSYKTSLGKYKIGGSYWGTFGLAYKLYGLDSTNSKAFERAIVLHSFNYVPDAETYPKNICESAGCPMVSRTFLSILGKYISSSSKPPLMWIYN